MTYMLGLRLNIVIGKKLLLVIPINSPDINNQYRKYTTKRNWCEDETKLLYWAIHTYTEKRNIKAENLVSADWHNIASLIPGRNDA
jgi:hypothetical protein